MTSKIVLSDQFDKHSFPEFSLFQLFIWHSNYQIKDLRQIQPPGKAERKTYFQVWLGTKTTPAYYRDDGEVFWRLFSCTNRGHNAISRDSFSEPCRLRDEGKENKF